MMIDVGVDCYIVDNFDGLLALTPAPVPKLIPAPAAVLESSSRASAFNIRVEISGKNIPYEPLAAEHCRYH